MALAYHIPYRDRYGEHVASKWGNSPKEAAAYLAAQLANRGCGVAEIGVPVPVEPQPFGFVLPPGLDLSALGSELSAPRAEEAGDLTLI